METNRVCSECSWWVEVDFEEDELDSEEVALMAFGICSGNGLYYDGARWRNCNCYSQYMRLRHDHAACPRFDEEE